MTPSANIAQGLNDSKGYFGAAYLANVQAAASGANEALIKANQAVAAADKNFELGWQAIGNAFLTGIGLSKQYEMLRQQGNLFESQREVALRNMTLAEKTFNDTFMPSHKMGMDFWEKVYRKKWEPILEGIVACGTKICEYKADYDRHTVRVLADVSKVINGARRTARRSMDCYSVGACFDNDYRFADLQSRMVIDAKNLGRAYEDDYAIKRDTFYWNRQTTAAQISQNIGTLAAGVMQYGKGAVATGLQTINAAGNGLDAAVASGFSALGQQGQFWGSLGGFAGNNAGSAYGNRVGQSLLGQGQTSFANVNAPASLPATYTAPTYTPGATTQFGSVVYEPAIQSSAETNSRVSAVTAVNGNFYMGGGTGLTGGGGLGARPKNNNSNINGFE